MVGSPRSVTTTSFSSKGSGRMLTEMEKAVVFQGLIKAEKFAELMDPG
jgi:hypothetical protein